MRQNIINGRKNTKFHNVALRYLAHPQMKYFQYNRLSTWWHCIYMRKLRHSVDIAETLLPRVWCWYGTCDTRTRARIHTLIILFFPFMKVQKTGESNFMKPSKFEDDSVAQNNIIWHWDYGSRLYFSFIVDLIMIRFMEIFPIIIFCLMMKSRFRDRIY